MVFDLLTDACFIVRDHNGRRFAYAYFGDKKGRRTAAKLLTRNQARRAKMASMLQAEITEEREKTRYFIQRARNFESKSVA
jgi:hypothetical protein